MMLNLGVNFNECSDNGLSVTFVSCHECTKKNETLMPEYNKVRIMEDR